MRKFGYILLFVLFTFSTACSSSGGRQTRIYQTGEKAPVDKLSYAVIDTQIYPRLGDDPNNPRVPQHRFYAVQLAISSGNNSDTPIPAMSLIDDSGKVYTELADGTGLRNWLGVVRHVSPAQTERGLVLFDAPAAHYKLKLTDDLDTEDVYIDLPLNFLHEQLNNEAAGGGGDTNAAAADLVPGPRAATAPAPPAATPQSTPKKK